MIYIIIDNYARVFQVDQLTEEILEAYQRDEVEILQVPASSITSVTTLAGIDGDEISWEPIKAWPDA